MRWLENSPPSLCIGPFLSLGGTICCEPATDRLLNLCLPSTDHDYDGHDLHGAVIFWTRSGLPEGFLLITLFSNYAQPPELEEEAHRSTGHKRRRSTMPSAVTGKPPTWFEGNAQANAANLAGASGPAVGRRGQAPSWWARPGRSLKCGPTRPLHGRLPTAESTP